VRGTSTPQLMMSIISRRIREMGQLLLWWSNTCHSRQFRRTAWRQSCLGVVQMQKWHGGSGHLFLLRLLFFCNLWWNVINFFQQQPWKHIAYWMLYGFLCSFAFSGHLCLIACSLCKFRYVLIFDCFSMVDIQLENLEKSRNLTFFREIRKSERKFALPMMCS